MDLDRLSLLKKGLVHDSFLAIVCNLIPLGILGRFNVGLNVK